MLELIEWIWNFPSGSAMYDGVAQAIVPAEDISIQIMVIYIHSWHGSNELAKGNCQSLVGTTQSGWSAGPEIGWRPKGEGDKKAVRWSPEK